LICCDAELLRLFWLLLLLLLFCPRPPWLPVKPEVSWLKKLLASPASAPTNWPACRLLRKKRSLPVICPIDVSPRVVAPASEPPVPATPPPPAPPRAAALPPKLLAAGLKLPPIDRAPNAPPD